MTDEELYQFLFSMFMDGYLVSASKDEFEWSETATDEIFQKFFKVSRGDSTRVEKHIYKARDDYNNIPLIKALG